MNEPGSDETIIDENSLFEEIDTIASDGVGQANANPLASLKRFKLTQQLGRGGCGSVFLAYDNQLQRDVAIKMLTRGHTAANQTLLTEARMQAKIEHPNICKIYQVEEADSDSTNSYLVMQYIQGQSALQWLKEHQEAVDTEHIVTLMQKVCDGLQAMHAQGIIHRDIKPANIMFADEGEFDIHPYMVDFGLANHDKDINNPEGKTVIAGTPAFMSPEQWQNAILDRRSDVYSFGATLYQLLTGLQPESMRGTKPATNRFEGERWHNLPVDLKAIVFKCMQPAREQRYQSARQVNQELLRFLTGEPVLSLPGKTYWIKKKLLKHKWQALLIFALGTGGITELVWQQYQQHQQQIREQWITTFTGRVESLEAKVHMSRLSARHDITEETARWQQEITTLNNEIETIGPSAYGPGHYAIGRMNYALGQYDEALAHLQKAWDSGFKKTRVAYNLALSHGAIYQRQKDILANISSRSQRKEKMVILDKQHRQPAIGYLEQGMSGSPYQSYTKALLQYYQGDQDLALTTLDKADDLPSWFYQHHILRGDIYLAKTEKAGTTYDDEQAQIHSKLSLQHYNKAAEQGRSDLHLQLKPLSVYLLLMNNSLYSKQRNFKKIYQQSSQTLSNAAVIAPQHFQIYFKKAQLLMGKNNYEVQYSGQPTTTGSQAIEQFKQALTLFPDNVDALLSLGAAYVQHIQQLQEQGLPVETFFTTAINIFDRIPIANRDYFFYNSYARVMLKSATHHAKQRQEKALSFKQAATNKALVDTYFKQAIVNYQHAIKLNPAFIDAYVNLGYVFRKWSSVVTPEDAVQKLQSAIEQYQIAHKLNPSHFVVNYYLAVSHRALAKFNTLLLRAAKNALDQANSYLSKATELKPGHPAIAMESVNLAIHNAIYQWQNGCPFEQTLNQAKLVIEVAVTKYPNNTKMLGNRASLFRVEQQLYYFSNPKVGSKIFDYSLPLRVVNSVNNKPHEDIILVSLLNNENQSFNIDDLRHLSPSDDASLAFAEWLSQSNYFDKAEAMFADIDMHYPSLTWLYRRQHLLRWIQYLKFGNLPSQMRVDSLNSQVDRLTTLLTKHFPALVALPLNPSRLCP